MEENPNMVQTSEKFHPAGFGIYAVSLDSVGRGKEYWVRFYSFFGLPSPNMVFHTFLRYKPVTSLSFLKIRSCSSMAITTNFT